MLRDREDKLDLADIGGEAGTATHDASIAGRDAGPSDWIYGAALQTQIGGRPIDGTDGDGRK
jgi:hypothetical protein